MIRLILIASVAIVVGCTPHPRYRTGGEERPPEVTQFGSVSTNDYIRLGTLLQGYLGRPYRGTSRYDRGLDCSEFTQTVFQRFKKIELPRTSAEQFKAGKAVNARQLHYGDLVFFTTEGNQISHVGIFVGGREFIHVSSSYGVVISSFDESYWAKRYAGARRILP